MMKLTRISDEEEFQQNPLYMIQVPKRLDEQMSQFGWVRGLVDLAVMIPLGMVCVAFTVVHWGRRLVGR